MAKFLQRRRGRDSGPALPDVRVAEERGIRSLYLGSDTIQSSMRLSDPSELVLTYTHAMMGFLLCLPSAPAAILHIGLGGGSLPRFCHARLPDTRNIAVELNPEVIAVARSLFALPEDERLRVIQGDGVQFVGERTAEFDAVLVDAFDGHDLIAEMVAEPFLHDCRQTLIENGVLVMNLWGNHPHYRRHVDCLRQAFDGRVLTLPAASHGNVAALALAGPAGHRLRLDALEARARQLTADVELDFMAMVAALKRDNPHTASRLLP